MNSLSNEQDSPVNAKSSDNKQASELANLETLPSLHGTDIRLVAAGLLGAVRR